MTPHRILFVCTGNICRSPTAEGVLRHKAAEAGLGEALVIDSAGLAHYHIGDPPDARAQRQAASKGYDLSDQRCRAVAPDDFERFDLLLGMDHGHVRGLGRQAPADRAERVRLFLDYAPGLEGRDVPDPYYGGMEDYALALDLIERGVEGLLASLVHKT